MKDNFQFDTYSRWFGPIQTYKIWTNKPGKFGPTNLENLDQQTGEIWANKSGKFGLTNMENLG